MKIDLRTRYGRETEVLKQVAKYGGFSIFWATENAARANAICRLEKRNAISEIKGAPYPWCKFQISAWK